MHIVTYEEATRTEHFPECAGYEDCDCFSMRHDHADIYRLQEENRQLKATIAALQLLMAYP